EYVSIQWLHFAPEGLAHRDEIAWMAGRAAEMEPGLAEIAARHGIAMLAGTAPAPAPVAGRFVNQARLFLPEGGPEGDVARQDKLCLTPSEKDPEGWHLATGDAFRVVEWRGLRLGIAICLDVELPALSARIAGLGLDLLLVPSMTELASGHARVFGCAKARAIELFCAVGAVGLIGDVVRPDRVEGNTSGAAVFLPCEEALGYTGVLGEIPPASSTTDPDGPLLVTSVPVGLIRRLRTEKAEVWPGAWAAQHVSIG
ncbi:MAG TPA: nitrilase-related carbon-nitrogen hydrolase, partial [Arenibaculum sp.]|nr:nitrilase-related carbon-nitrogen hydrolase [Arenibaculum sp.]